MIFLASGDNVAVIPEEVLSPDCVAEKEAAAAEACWAFWLIEGVLAPEFAFVIIFEEDPIEGMAMLNYPLCSCIVKMTGNNAFIF